MPYDLMKCHRPPGWKGNPYWVETPDETLARADCGAAPQFEAKHQQKTERKQRMSPKVVPKAKRTPEVREAERQSEEALVELGLAELKAEKARENASRRPTSEEAWRDVGLGVEDMGAQELYMATGSVYGVNSEHSYFKDLARVSIAGQPRSGQNEQGAVIGTFGDPLPPDQTGGGLGSARKRLATVETRDVVSGDPGAAAFMPTNAPNFVAEEFSLALRARGVMPGLLRVLPLPERGQRVDIPRFAAGASAAVQATEGTAASQTDIDLDTVSNNKVLIAGRQTLSVQAFEFADESFDRALAAELGSAIAAILDQQIISGTGTSGQMRGLLNVSGVTSVVKTNGTPTAATNYAAIGDLVNQEAVAYGAMPDLLILHPRRRAFIESKLAFQPGWLGLQPAAVNSVPSNLGGGTNEDRMIAVPSQEILLYLDRPRFNVYAEVLAGNLQVRAQSRLYGALVAGRKPAAIGVLSGTELATPAF